MREASPSRARGRAAVGVHAFLPGGAANDESSPAQGALAYPRPLVLMPTRGLASECWLGGGEAHTQEFTSHRPLHAAFV